MKMKYLMDVRLWHGVAFRIIEKIRSEMYIVCGCCLKRCSTSTNANCAAGVGQAIDMV